MRYNVAHLLKEPTGSARSYQLDETFTGALRIVDRVHGEVSLLRTHRGMLVTAELDTHLTLTCSRCLREFARRSTVAIEEEAFPTVDVNTGRSLSLPVDTEGALSTAASHVLDLTETVRQYVITDEPMRPLCQENCRGLCLVCGAALNQGNASVAPDEPDRRGEPLAALLNRQNG